MYAVVLFKNGDVSVVPSNWLTDANCKWPTSASKDKRTMIMKKTVPEDEWSDYEYKLIGGFDEYEDALKAEKNYAKSTTDEEDILRRPKGKRRVVKSKKNEDYIVPDFQNYEQLSEPESSTNSIEPKSVDHLDSPHSSESWSADEAQDKNPPPTVAIGQKEPHDISTTLEIIDLDKTVIVGSVEEKLQLILDLTLENRAMLKMLVTRRDQKNNVDEADERLAREIIQLLPLKSINALLEFEQKVKDNEQFALAVLQKLSIIGGSDFKNNTRRIMTALFTNDVGMLVSWTGQKDNLKIGDFTIMEIVRKAVKKGYTTATDREFELAVSEWLRYSRQRKGREKRIDGHLLQ